MTLTTSYRGDTDVAVFKSPKHKEPHFIVIGAPPEDLDRRKLREYLEGCDWTDKGSRGWITPRIRCDDFLKKTKRITKTKTRKIKP